jgi:hypothetical protein
MEAEMRLPNVVPRSARYFFHLCNGEEIIPDEVGVEVGEVDRLRDVFVQTLQEMQNKEELTRSEFDGWEVRVADGTEIVVTRFRLGDLACLKDLSRE